MKQAFFRMSDPSHTECGHMASLKGYCEHCGRVIDRSEIDDKPGGGESRVAIPTSWHLKIYGALK